MTREVVTREMLCVLIVKRLCPALFSPRLRRQSASRFGV